MNTDLLFQIYNSAVLVAWLAMWIAPRTRFTEFLAQTYIFPLVYSISYTVLMTILLLQSGEFPDFGTFSSIVQLFTKPEAVLVGWIHYLAFDLFVGTWAYQDAQKRRVPHYIFLPCSVLTLMFAPAGFAAYWFVRNAYPAKA